MSLNPIDILKLPNKILVPLSLVSGVILFSPNKLLEKIYLINFRENWGFIIGLSFLVSTAIILTSVGITLYKFLREKYDNKQFKKISFKVMKEMDNYKKSIVYSLFLEESNTKYLSMNDGAIKSLEGLGMIAKVNNFISSYDLAYGKLNYFLQPWVVKMLKDNSELEESYKKAYEGKWKE